MAKARLIVTDAYSSEGYYYIAWFDPDEGLEGGYLGQSADDGLGEPPKDPVDREHWAASKAVRSITKTRGKNGMFLWESLKEANKALAAAKAAIKADKAERPLPEWAIKALSEGWKKPKGWTP